MAENHQISFGYSINERSVSIKVESNGKIENFDKYKIIKDMLSEENGFQSEKVIAKELGLINPSAKEKQYESQFKDWIRTLEQRISAGIKPGVLKMELTDLLEQTLNIFLPIDKFTLIGDTIVDKDDLLYNYFEKSVYPLLQT